MMHRHGWTGPTAPSNTCYAWFIWDARDARRCTFIGGWFDWRALPRFGSGDCMMSVRRVRASVRTGLSAIFLVYAGNNGGGRCLSVAVFKGDNRDYRRLVGPTLIGGQYAPATSTIRRAAICAAARRGARFQSLAGFRR
jgi:hypothetical protein